MAQYAALAGSGFLCAAFNSAIFDGPVRIYFSQIHEPTALKIYFLLQQAFEGNLANVKSTLPHPESNLMVMIYPDAETRHLSFPNESREELALMNLWDEHLVIGMTLPIEDDDIAVVCELIGKCLKNKTGGELEAF